MSLQTKELGSFLKRSRNLVSIIDDKAYKLVRIRLHHKGVELRSIVKGKDLGSNKMHQVSEGQFILSGIDARNGAFGIIPKDLDGAVVTNDFWCFDLDGAVIDKRFFLKFTSTNLFDDICRKASDGTTNRVRLQANKFFNYQINLPAIEEQKKLTHKFSKIEEGNNALLIDLSRQDSLVQKLRQAFLREAMQGKLVPHDPNDEPASELLKKIKAEKEKLIKEGKLRKEKPLPEIKAEEVPFAIPENWVWCRLGEIIGLISGQHIETGDYNDKKFGYPYLTGPSDFGEKHPNPTKWTTKPKVFANIGDILITVKGSGVGKTNISNIENVVISRQLMAIRPIIVSRDFVYFFLENSFDQLQSEKKGTGIPGIGRENILEKIFFLPPLAAQRRIVAKLNSLMSLCDSLAQSIAQSKSQTQMLLQAVLKESLSPNNE
ncbi:MAG: restriction endonuclease subunit S [Chitinivibrionales bacterium]|nr:restriction endonuclease subunit S [Chitinivibrionales bacterium]